MTADLRCHSSVWFDDAQTTDNGVSGANSNDKTASSTRQNDYTAVSRRYTPYARQLIPAQQNGYRVKILVFLLLLPLLLLLGTLCIPLLGPLSFDIFFLRVTVSTRGSTPKPQYPTSPAPSEVALAFDHFRFANGARIIDELTSPSLHVPATSLLNDSRALIHHVNSALEASAGPPSAPEAALGIYVDPRVLWYFAGSRGQLGIAPARPLRVDRVGVKTIPFPQAETCVPDQLTLWGLIGVQTDEQLNQLLQEFPRRPIPEGMLHIPFLRGLTGFKWVALADYQAAASGGLHRVPSDATSSGLHKMNLLQYRGLIRGRTPVYSHAFVLTLERRSGDPGFSCFAGISAFGVLGD